MIAALLWMLAGFLLCVIVLMVLSLGYAAKKGDEAIEDIWRDTARQDRERLIREPKPMTDFDERLPCPCHSRRGFLCCLPLGHPGDHVAEDGFEICDQWPAERHPLMDCPDCGKFRGHGHVCDEPPTEKIG